MFHYWLYRIMDFLEECTPEKKKANYLLWALTSIV